MRLRSHPSERDERAVIAPHGRIDATLADASSLSAAELAHIAEFRQRTGMTFAEALVDLGLATSEAVNQTIIEHMPAGLIDPESSGVSAAVVAVFDADNPLTVKLRALRAILFGPDDLRGGLRTLVLTGVGTNKSSGVAANLAVLVAQLGRPVLLVDANFNTPTQAALFGVAWESGVTSVLTDTQSVDAAVIATPAPNLDLLGPGPSIPLLSETVERVSLVTRLRAMRKSYACAIIDAGDQPADVIAAIARGADAVVPIVERGATDLVQLRTLLSQLERNEIAVPGTVLA